MARALTFALDGQEFVAAPAKVDRARLYGWTETVAVDADGNACEFALVDSSGTTVIPRGGTGIGLLDGSGSWVERSGLIAVTADGEPAPEHPSSFDAPVCLDQQASVEDLLDTPVTAVYQLTTDPALVGAIGERIFTFDYFFRAGPTGSKAFVLVSDSVAFLLTGQPAAFGFVGLDAPVEPVDDADGDDDDDLDFGMM